MPAPIVEAVTAVLLHGEQLFLTQRQPALAAFPGYHAFPGGKVDKGDHATPLPGKGIGDHPPQLMRALIRELREEIGFDLGEACESGLVASVACLGEATTPDFLPLRFRTWFFKVELSAEPALAVDTGEATHGEWDSLANWRARFASGRLLIAPPTRIAIESLLDDRQLTALPRMDLGFDPQADVPWIEPLGGLRVLLVRSNTLPPAIHTNVFWLGGEPGALAAPRVVIDPSPADRTEFARLCKVLDEFGVDLVFLTHHHPDHREYADEVARRYRVPLALSADTRARIEAQDPKFFNGLDVKLLGEGDLLTQWQGEPVELVAVPGHDEGQLAPMPRSRAWCIVGDLIQGVGTVVIAPPEGNMRKYFESLRKVIALDPAVIIPSHGMAMGTTHYLKKALQHREAREQEVLARHRAGIGEDQMLREIYAGVDPRLLPLARINIRSHLQKLREDGALA
jgi:ribonuclease/clavin/mitogillin